MNEYEDDPVGKHLSRLVVSKVPKTKISRKDIEIARLPMFLQEYIQHCKELTDASNKNILTGILAPIASLINTKAYVKSNVAKIYCNIWSIIIGPSTICRKSTCIKNLPLPILQELQDKEDEKYEYQLSQYENLQDKEKKKELKPVDKFLIFPNSITGEALFETLAYNPAGLFVYSEIASFMTKLNKAYNGDLKADLVDMYDVDYNQKKKTKTTGTIIVKKPCFSISCATTKEWFLQELKQDNDSKSGFLQRFLICNSTDIDTAAVDLKYKRIENKKQDSFLSNLYNSLIDLKPIGELLLTKEAIDIYDKEKKEVFDTLFKQKTEIIYSFASRIYDGYFFKFCMMFSIIGNLRHEQSLEITYNNVKQALYLCDFYFDNAKNFVLNELTETFELKNEKKIIDVLKARDSLNRGELMRFTNMQKKYFDVAISNLVLKEIINEEKLLGYKNKPSLKYSLINE